MYEVSTEDILYQVDNTKVDADTISYLATHIIIKIYVTLFKITLVLSTKRACTAVYVSKWDD